MRKGIKVTFALLMTFMLLVLAACGSTEPASNTGTPGAGSVQRLAKAGMKQPRNKIRSLSKSVSWLQRQGPLESYGKQTIAGFELGLEYATGGTKEVNGHPIEVVVEDTETKPEVAVQKATKLLEEDK